MVKRIRGVKKTIKILVIDDDFGIRELIKEGLSLSKTNYEIIAAWDSISGFKAIREEKPDVVILDLHMPNGDGFGVIEKIRKDANLHHTKIIMLTANPSKKNKFEGLDLGVDLFMAKPFDFLELEANINALIDK